MKTPPKKPTPRKIPAVARPVRPARSSRKAASAQPAVVAIPPLPAEAIFPPLRRVRLTMPEPDFAKVRVLKERLRGLGRPTRKNELVRAGLAALTAMPNEELLLFVEQLDPTKPPRKKKSTQRAKPTKRATSGPAAARVRKTSGRSGD